MPDFLLERIIASHVHSHGSIHLMPTFDVTTRNQHELHASSLPEKEFVAFRKIQENNLSSIFWVSLGQFGWLVGSLRRAVVVIVQLPDYASSSRI